MKYIIPAILFTGIFTFPHLVLALETATLELSGRSIPENSISVSETTHIKPTPVTYSPTVSIEGGTIVSPSPQTLPSVPDLDGDAGKTTRPIIQYNETNLEFIKAKTSTTSPTPTPVSAGGAVINGTTNTQKVTPPPTKPIRDHSGASDVSAGKGANDADRTAGDPDFELLNISIKDDGLKNLHLEATEGDASMKVGVRGWDPKKKEEILAHPERVKSAEDLNEYVEAVVLNDTSISDISVTKNAVEIQSAEEVKLFWFIPVQLTRVITINMEVGGSATDRVKVRFPWYRIFVKKSETSDELKAEVSAKLVGAVWANVDDAQSITDAGRISHTLQVVSGILKTKHDTAKNSVGNIR